MNKIFIYISIFVLGMAFLNNSKPVTAAKKRVRNTSTPVRVAGTAYSSARLNRASNSMIVTFLNLHLVKSNDYILSYHANGIEQGVGGSIISKGSGSESRDLYFGTCSHGVCTPHYNITNAVLTVTTTLNSGSTHTKRYRIKV